MRVSAILALCWCLLAAGGVRGPAAADGSAINLGAMPIAGAAEAFYAQELGFFKKAGLDVTLTVLNNGSSIVAAALSGSLDIGFASPSPVILAHLKGLPIRYVTYAPIYNGPPPVSALMVAKTSKLRSGADLNGARVAVAGLRDIAQFQVQAWIDQNGGNSESAAFVEMPYAEMAAALEAGRVVAAAGTEPYISAAVQGNARILGSLNEVVARRFALAGWFSTDGWLQRNPELAERFIAVIQQSARWANTHPKEAALLLERYTKITPEVAAVMVKMQFDEGGRPDPRLLQPVVDMIAKYGKTAGFNAAELVWTR